MKCLICFCPARFATELFEGGVWFVAWFFVPPSGIFTEPSAGGVFVAFCIAHNYSITHNGTGGKGILEGF